MSNPSKLMKVLAVIGISSVVALTGCGKESSTASSEFIGDQVDYQIIGIDPGAGLMKSTEKALKEYDLKDWKLVEGSGAAMAAALDKAYKDKKPIIVTGWTPHWKFAKYELKYLADPKGVYGGDEQIHTIARNGLKDDHPSAHALLDRFEWSPDDMAKVMVAIQEGKKPEQAAADWIKDNGAKVDEWVKDIPKAEGKTLKLAYVAWDSEIASTNVVKQVLESKLGYKVEMLQVEAGPMWAGIAGGDADAIVAAWLPTTHKDYYDKYQGKFEDLGPNLNGTKIGLVVPSYMNIDSIEDLKKK
ncbi:glycine betaine ABC transporter substrate-binding protein [Paenibacillus validus]|uniref:glycine betaine ABC transporter substrate-binding protein n=1 Tax=Paenibacillus TaxID=44249 RepID=UPI000FD6CC28|nr:MULTISPECIES: glycine betaine ABC transporter substrate-binding protein [Paenibacillus]MED4602080.1 glycine betaine ABC transporter substrate-binding protein [Paenibacillus validus]MED4608483.1 glycine betaine ABC transporter substrate-binding protein [Paenibacillus validus]